MKKEMLFALLAIGFFTLGTISPILGQGSRKYNVVYEQKGLKGESIKLRNTYAFVLRICKEFCLSGDTSLNVFNLNFTDPFIIKPDIEKFIDQDFIMCGVRNKNDETVNYLILKNEYKFSCQKIADLLNDETYDFIMSRIEAEQAKQNNEKIMQQQNNDQYDIRA